MDVLVKVLRTGEDEMVRAGAARALGEIGDARAVEPLIRMLSAPSGQYAFPLVALLAISRKKVSSFPSRR